MPASTEQKVDFLLKKIGYTASKSGLAEDSSLSGTKKAPFAESIPSPIAIPSTNIWADSTSIPATPPGSDSSIVKGYRTATALRLTVDSTVSGSRAFIAYTTYNNTSTPILGDWIDTQFGSDYIVKVYKGDPNSGGTQLSAAGAGSNDTWFFDYASGILNFNGTQIPSGVTDTNIYLIGYRYIGEKGAKPPGGIGTFHNLYVAGVSTFVGVGTFNSHLYVGGNLEVKGTTKFEGGTLTFGDSDTDNVVFGADVDSNIIPDDDSTYDLGSTGQRWKKLWVDEISIGGTFRVGQDIETRHLLVTGISTFQDDATFEGATSGRNVVWDKSEDSLEFADNAKAVFGSSESLEIFHDSSDSYIKDVGTGSLNLTSNGRGFLFTKGGSEQIANLLTDSAVELFWNGIKRVSTSGIGVTIYDQLDTTNLNVSGVSTFSNFVDINSDLDVDGKTDLDDLSVAGVSTFSEDVRFSGAAADAFWDRSQSSLEFADDSFAVFGDGRDMRVYHSGGHSYIANDTGNLKLTADSILLRNNADSADLASFTAGGSVSLYHNNALKLITTGIGVSILNGVGNTATLAAPANFVIDPDTVGDDTGSVRIRGDLYVDGAQFIVSSSVIQLDDHVVGIATTSGTNNLLDGAGIGIGSANIMKTLLWNNASASLKSSENFDLLDNKVYKINGTTVLSKDSLGIGITNIHGVIEQLVAKNLRVTGVSTFTGAVDANNRVDIALDLDVDGKTDLDDLSVAGVSTFSALVDINAGGQANTFKVEDLTDNRIVLAGSGGELEDDASLTFDGSTLTVGANRFVDINGDLDVDGKTDLDDLSVAGVSTFSAFVDVNSDIDVDGKTDLDDLSVAGVSTFTAFVDVNSDIDVDGKTDLDDLSVVGVSTFSAFVDVNSDIDVDGKTDLDDLSVAGVSTLTDLRIGNANSIDIIRDEDDMASDDVNALATQQSIKKYVDDRTPAGPGGSELTVSADSGTNQVIDLATEVLDIEGTSNEIETVTGTNKVVVGLPDNVTITNKLTVTGDLDVDGKTDLDDLSVAGVSTLTDLRIGNTNSIDIIRDEDNMASDDVNALATQQSIKAYVDSQVTAQDLDFVGDTGSGSIDLDSETFQVTGTPFEIVTTGSGQVLNVGLPDDVIIGAGLTVTSKLTVGGSATVGIATILDEDDMASNRADALATQQSIKAYVDTNVTAQDLDFVGDSGTGSVDLDSEQLDIEGTANEIVTSASGQKITIALPDDVTIGNRLNVTGDLDVDGKTNLDDLSVAGVSTFASNIDANGNLDVDGQTDLDVLNVAETATFSAFVDVNSDIDVDGKTDLDDLSVAGVSTLTDLRIGNAISIDIIRDEDDMASDDPNALATQQSIKKYVDDNVTAQDLDITDGTTNIAIDLDSEVLSILGTANEVTSVASANSVTLGLPDNVIVSAALTATGNFNVGTGGTILTALVGAAASVGIGSALPDYMLDVSGAINSEDDVKIQGVSVLTSSLDEAVAMAIALG